MGAFIEQVQQQTRQIQCINTARQQKELEKQHKNKLLRILQIKIDTIFNLNHDISVALSLVYDINQREKIIFDISHKEKDLIILDENYDKIVKKIQTRYTNYNKYCIELKERKQQEEKLCAVLENIIIKKQEQEHVAKEQLQKEKKNIFG